MWFWLALIALLCWSGSDLFSKIGSKPDDQYSHLKMVMAVGLVMGLHACYEMFVGGVSISLGAIWTYLPVSFFYISSMTIGYVGLRYIELSISSPICNCSGALVALLCFVFLGERLGGLQLAGVILICAGVIGLGFVEMNEDEEARALRENKSNIKYTRSLLALMLPVIYCLLDAAGGFADTIVLETLDEAVANVAYELTFLFMGVCSFIYVVFIKHEKLTVQRELPKLAGGLFETAGQFAYIYALSSNPIAAAPMISAYCLLSVLWSRIFLREHLSLKHYLTIFTAIAGIVILGIAEGA